MYLFDFDQMGVLYVFYDDNVYMSIDDGMIWIVMIDSSIYLFGSKVLCVIVIMDVFFMMCVFLDGYVWIYFKVVNKWVDYMVFEGIVVV